MTDAVDILRCIFVPSSRENYVQVFLSYLVPQIQTVSTKDSLDTQCEIVCMEDWIAGIPVLSSLVKLFIFRSETFRNGCLRWVSLPCDKEILVGGGTRGTH